MAILTRTEEEQLLHYGEAFHLWEHLSKAKGCSVKYQILHKHCENKELASFITNMLDNVVIPEIKKMETLLIDNGVDIPPTPPEKAKADANSIPAGARFLDTEIAACIANDIAMNLVACSQIIALSYREDIGKMFALHHAQLIKYGHELQSIMKKNGWLVKPPYHRELAGAVR